MEDEVTAVVDYGNGATGVFVTATHDIVGTDRFEILGDQGKIVVENSKTATVTRLTKPERELSDAWAWTMSASFMGELNPEEYYTTEVIEFESRGAQHSGVLENFAANILDGTLLAPGSDGINGVRLANAIHLQLTGTEVGLDFDEDVSSPS